MGTIAEKLTYLDETREKIKNAINVTGAEITKSDTFRSYSGKLSDSLVNIINNGTDELYQNFPKISNSEASENIELTPTYEAKMEIELYPQTKQNSTSGKNLFPMIADGTYTRVGLTIVVKNGVATFNGTSTAGSLWLFASNRSDILNGKYCLSTNVSGSAVGEKINTALMNSSAYVLTASQGNDASANFSNQLITNYGVYINKGITFTDFVLRPQLEKNDTPTNFEPYTNGPSPNPEYPQEIYGTTGETVIDTHNSNLFDESKILTGTIRDDGYIGFAAAGRDFYIMDWKENTQYAIQGVFKTSGTGTVRFRILYTDGAKDDNSLNPNNATDDTLKSMVTLPNKTVEKIQITYGSNGSLYLKRDTFQIEEKNTVPDYVPHKENQYKINLGNSLITMYEGDNFVKQNDAWYIERNIKKKIFDGSENWTYSRSSNNLNRFRLVHEITNLNIDLLGLSNYFIYEIVNAYNRIFLQPNSLFIVIDIATVEEFTAWLSQHNTELLYHLAEPEYELITDTNLISQLEAVYSMKSYDGTTYIASSNSSSLPFKIKASALKKSN